jgi:hypothetical protein
MATVAKCETKSGSMLTRSGYRKPGRSATVQLGFRTKRAAEHVVPGSTGSQIATELLPDVVELEHESLLAGGLQQVGPAEHAMYNARWGRFLPYGAGAPSA